MKKSKVVFSMVAVFSLITAGSYHLITTDHKFSILYAIIAVSTFIVAFAIGTAFDIFEIRPYLIVLINIPALVLIAFADVTGQPGAVVSVLLGSCIAVLIILTYILIR